MSLALGEAYSLRGHVRAGNGLALTEVYEWQGWAIFINTLRNELSEYAVYSTFAQDHTMLVGAALRGQDELLARIVEAEANRLVALSKAARIQRANSYKSSQLLETNAPRHASDSFTPQGKGMKGR